jgi:hypothetical protein
VAERGRVEACEPWVEVLDQLDLEAVLAQRLVVGRQLVALSVVGAQLEAAAAAERVSGELAHMVEVTLGQAPELGGRLGPELLASGRVPQRRSAQREAAVPPAGA